MLFEGCTRKVYSYTNHHYLTPVPQPKPRLNGVLYIKLNLRAGSPRFYHGVELVYISLCHETFLEDTIFVWLNLLQQRAQLGVLHAACIIVWDGLWDECEQFLVNGLDDVVTVSNRHFLVEWTVGVLDAFLLIGLYEGGCGVTLLQLQENKHFCLYLVQIYNVNRHETRKCETHHMSAIFISVVPVLAARFQLLRVYQRAQSLILFRIVFF